MRYRQILLPRLCHWAVLHNTRHTAGQRRRSGQRQPAGELHDRLPAVPDRRFEVHAVQRGCEVLPEHRRGCLRERSRNPCKPRNQPRHEEPVELRLRLSVVHSRQLLLHQLRHRRRLLHVCGEDLHQREPVAERVQGQRGRGNNRALRAGLLAVPCRQVGLHGVFPEQQLLPDFGREQVHPEHATARRPGRRLGDGAHAGLPGGGLQEVPGRRGQVRVLS